MALYKVLCAVAVTIFLAPNGCLSDELECGQGSRDLQALDMPWIVLIFTSPENVCGGTVISCREVLTSCRCNGSLDQVELQIGPNRTPSSATSFKVFGDDEDAEENMEDIACVYILSEPSTMTPICLPEEGTGIEVGTEILVGACDFMIIEPNVCNSSLSDFKEDQLCVEALVGCQIGDGFVGVYFDEEEDSWFTAGITITNLAPAGAPIPISTVSFLDNDNMTNDCNVITPTPMLQTSNFPFSTDVTGTPGFTGTPDVTGTPGFTGTPGVTGTPDVTGTPGFTGTPVFTTIPQPPTKCPKPHPPKTTKPPCGCGDDEDDFRDDSLFGSGVMMNSSPFILLCVLVISLYSTYC